MSDMNHYWGDDLQITDIGDLSLADGVTRGRQRVLRRLLTAVRGYIWHLDYGAGVPQHIGRTIDLPEITGLIKGQMAQEAAVSQIPAPTITLRATTDGLYCQIRYLDSPSQTLQDLSFEVTP